MLEHQNYFKVVVTSEWFNLEFYLDFVILNKENITKKFKFISNQVLCKVLTIGTWIVVLAEVTVNRMTYLPFREAGTQCIWPQKS